MKLFEINSLFLRSFFLQNLQMLVIDEADRILDVGFEEELRQIILVRRLGMRRFCGGCLAIALREMCDPGFLRGNR